MASKESVRTVIDFIRLFSNLMTELEKMMVTDEFNFNETRIIFELLDEGVISAKELELRLDMDKGYMSRMIKGLIDKDIIEKDQSIEDKRLFLLRLTYEGEEKGELLYQEYIQHIYKKIDTLSPTKQKQLQKALQTLLKLGGQ